MEIFESNAGVDQAVVKDFIWACGLVSFDLFKKAECSFKVFVISLGVFGRLNSLDQSTESKVVWNDSIVLHLCEKIPSFFH